MTRFSSWLVIAVVSLAGWIGCSSSSTPATGDGGPAGCTAYQVPAGTDLTTPMVSFKTDVVPIFQGSCALSTSCHGGATPGSDNGVYLGGSKTQQVDPATIIAAIVGKKSIELASMDFVAAKDPVNSYLMHKMDGDNCVYKDQCGAIPLPDCGNKMPSGSDVLDVATRDTIRRWIAQGALNN